MIEIRSPGAFCDVLTTCHPDKVDDTLAALGLAREQVILTAPLPRADLDALRLDLRESKDRESALRDEVRTLSARADDAGKSIVSAQTAMARMKQERDEARTTIRGLARAFGKDPDAPTLATPTPEPAAAPVAEVML